MPYRSSVPLSHSPLRLILCIAAGLWLGYLAIVLSAWAIQKVAGPVPLPGPVNAVVAPAPAASGQVQRPASTPAPVQAPAAVPAPAIANAPGQVPNQDASLFDQYQQNLHHQQVEQVRGNPRNLGNPKCQYWLQQDANAPSQQTWNNLLQVCE